jgi:hypothetical protein
VEVGGCCLSVLVERVRRPVGEEAGRHLGSLGWCVWVLVARWELRLGRVLLLAALMGRRAVVPRWLLLCPQCWS